MRVLKRIFLFLLFVVLLSSLALMIFIKTFDFDRYRTRIESEVGSRIGRNVQIGRLDLNVDLTKGIVLDVHDLKIDNPTGLSAEPFLSLSKVRLRLEVMPLLKKREIIVSDAAVIEPRIYLIRNAQGRLNVPETNTGSPDAAPSGAGAPVKVNDDLADRVSSSGMFAIPQWWVRTIRLEQGLIIWEDRQETPVRKISVDHLDVTVKDFSLSAPFTILLDAAVFRDQPNLHLRAQAHFFPESNKLRFTDGELEFDLNDLDLRSLETILPGLFPDIIQGPLAGKNEIEIKELTVGHKGLESLSLNGTVSDGRLILTGSPRPLEQILVKYSITEKRIEVSDLSLALASGRVNGRAAMTDYLGQPKTELDVTIRQIPLGELLPPFDKEIRFYGEMNGKARLSFQGFEPDRITQTLTGPVDLQIVDGRLENFNALKIFLDRISIIPNLYEKIYANLTDKYKKQMETNTTQFAEIKADLTAENGLLILTQGHASADTFAIEVKGSLDRQMILTLEAALSIPEELSLNMIESASELEYIVAEDGRITIPCKPYQGPLAALQMWPDLEYLSKRILINRGSQELDKFLNKVLGTEETAPSDPGSQTEEGTDPLPQNTPERELIENVLDVIF